MKQLMINHATEYGRNNLSSYVLGTIGGKMYSANCEKIVADTKEIMKNYYEVFLDNSLPWNEPELKKTPADTGAEGKYIQLDITTLDAVMEGIPAPWTIDDLPNWAPENIQRNDA